MRVTLVHNPKAGNSSPRGDELVARAKAAGHEVCYRFSKEPGLARALEEASDVVVIAGGDGTVCSVARRLAGKRRPIAILPLGNSNNIASALGLGPDTSAEELFGALAEAPRRYLSVAAARGPFGSRLFLESAGIGCFAALFDKTLDADGGDGQEDRRSRGLRRLRHALSSMRPVPARIEVDGHLISGEYLLVAAMNIPAVGPHLELAPCADPSDEWLDLVLVREEDRAVLDAYLAGLLDGRGGAPALESHRARLVRLPWEPQSGHLDDGRWPAPQGEAIDAARPMVELSIADPPLEVLVTPIR